MTHLSVTLSNPVVQIALAVTASSLVLALTRTPRSAKLRRGVLYGLWILSGTGLAVWTMWLQRAVLTGGHLPSTYDTVVVPIKGTIRYVPQDLAYLHTTSDFVFLLCMVAFIVIVRFVDNEA